ncbi:MAG: YgiQ family radical SAM protein [Clostridiales bacterium 43-6]|nr:MAG: YgiQ family radical SAM protein [Clostridiales bacterium 43-6]
MRKDKCLYAKAAKTELDENDYITGKRLFQEQETGFLVCNPPMPPLTTQELDEVYALPFMKYYHPVYENQGGIAAIEEVEFSITHNRGCFSGCNFCALAFHQGRSVTSRSPNSVIQEGKALAANPRFKGYIHDVGGPTANYRKPSCEKQLKSGLCRNKRCLSPSPCDKLEVSHREYLGILRSLRSIPKVKKVFVRSGIRFDYLIADRDDSFFKELIEHHISGQLKVAPEHCSAAVLDKMGKPHIQSYKKFASKFYQLTKTAGKEQYLVPYLMSSHPGSTLKSAVELAVFLKRENIRPEQVQDFYPTPGTISTAMYYTGINPYSMEPVYVPKTPEEKASQRALLQYFLPKNRDKVMEALKKAGRTDLIGSGKDCLVFGSVPQKKTAPGSKKGKNTGRKADNGWQGKRKR